ncbi:hypothetical protein OG21DRAFT_1497340 [Imleria badia]|nr:hypothetical protein OG21DRAFT_1497340 [Imleria badia]
MSGPGPQNFNEVSRRIRTLTSILQALKARSEPTCHRENVPRFLRHFVTLLTCGDKHCPYAAKVVAATGRIESDGTARTLLVTQNRDLKSEESTLRVTEIHKAEKSFDDIVNGPADASSLEDHIADIWAALKQYNKGAADEQNNLVALQRFVVTRSYRKLSARFQEDRQSFDGRRLFDVIKTWEPLEGEDDEAKLQPRWVPIPGALAHIFPDLMPEEYRRDVGGQLQWKLSNKTSPLWVRLLVTILMGLDRSIRSAEKPLKGVGRNALTPEQSSAVADVAVWCNSLYIFVFWKEVLQDLLENTSLGEHLGGSLNFKDVKNEENEDDTELMPEPNEHTNKTVLRYLKTVVAWHAALEYLTDQRVSKRVTTNFLVGLVKVSPGNKSMLTAKELVPMYRRRIDPGDDDNVKRKVRVLEEHCKSLTFTGTVHAEASLMGLLAYEHYNRDKSRNNGDPIEGEGLLDDFLGRQLDTVNEIAVSKKCCWCCYRLAKLLQDRLPNQFGLPGTHGLVYAWNPPAVGIDVEVLTDLEDDLWTELQKALQQNRTHIHSRQSSASSTASPRLTEMWPVVSEELLDEVRSK